MKQCFCTRKDGDCTKCKCSILESENTFYSDKIIWRKENGKHDNNQSPVAPYNENSW
jgi:hypothetical protein